MREDVRLGFEVRQALMNRMCSAGTVSMSVRYVQYDSSDCLPPSLSQYLNSDFDSNALRSISSWLPSMVINRQRLESAIN